jgi:hypothetical protein
MKELLRTNDPVLLSWAKSVLADEGVMTFVFDRNASIVEGSIGAIQQRIMVADDELDEALRILEAAGYDPAVGHL